MTITEQLAGPVISSEVLELDWEGWHAEHRDWRGRWAHEGSAPAGKAGEYIKSVTGHLHPRQLDQYDVGNYKRGTLNPAYQYTPEQRKAIRAYTGSAYADINEAARSGRDDGSSAAAAADELSSAMQPLPEDMLMLREVNGAHALGDVKVGDLIADPGFSSTTIAPGGRFAAGRSGTTIMHILAPKGTPTVWANPAADYPEDEMILDRGQPMQVMKVQPRKGRSDVTEVFLLALPKEAVT